MVVAGIELVFICSFLDYFFVDEILPTNISTNRIFFAPCPAVPSDAPDPPDRFEKKLP
jgi:hypothetical protein